VWARRAESTRFSTTRLRPGYEIEQVDAFLEAIRDTFLGVEEPPLTADEVRDKQFTTTSLRKGYDEEEVDAFLEEVEARLRIRCAECGTLAAEVAQLCARCGAPVSGQRSAAANPSASGPRGVETAPAAARDAWSPPAWMRHGQRYFLISLAFFLLLYVIGVAGLNATPQHTGLHHTTG
jgi:DivIVA domain-containing protein